VQNHQAVTTWKGRAVTESQGGPDRAERQERADHILRRYGLFAYTPVYYPLALGVRPSATPRYRWPPRREAAEVHRYAVADAADVRSPHQQPWLAWPLGWPNVRTALIYRTRLVHPRREAAGETIHRVRPRIAH
jgi:hypothetical protein